MESMQYKRLTKECDSGVSLKCCFIYIVFIYCLPLVLAQHECPQQCVCDNNGLNVECRERSLTDLPHGKYSEDTKFLDLSGNNIETLKNSSFYERNLLELKYLNLSHNKMSVVETHSLRGVTHLEILDLSWNNITRMSPDVFGDLRNLIALHINNNPFIVLLEYDLPNLVTLDLSGCGIQTWPHNFFSGMGNITSLNLSNNKISQVEMQGIENLTLLAILNLRNNSLRVLQRELLRLDNIIEIDLSENPWHCDCELMAVFWLYEERTYKPQLTCNSSSDETIDSAVIVSTDLSDRLNCTPRSVQSGGFATWNIIVITIAAIVSIAGLIRHQI